MQKKKLFQALTRLAKVAGQRGQTSVSGLVRFYSEGGHIYAHATDLTVHARVDLGESVLRLNHVVDIHALKRLVKSTRDTDLSLFITSDKFVIRGKSEIELTHHDVVWPEFPTPSTNQHIPVKQLKFMLRYATLATAKNDMRRVLNSVRLTIRDGSVCFAASDGYRFHWASVEAEGDNAEISIKNPKTVLGLLEKDEGRIAITETQNGVRMVSILSGDTEISVPDINGLEHPPYENIYDAGYTETVAVVDVDDFVAAVELTVAAGASERRANSLAVNGTFVDTEHYEYIRISGGNDETWSITNVAATYSKHADGTLLLDPRYLRDAANPLAKSKLLPPSRQITLHRKGTAGQQPGHFYITGNLQGGVHTVAYIMPIRVVLGGEQNTADDTDYS